MPKLRYPKYHSGMMPTSRDLPTDRLPIGQLLVRLLRQFRAELFEPAGGHGYPDLREPHLHIFGNLGVDGIRLTDLAARAQLSLATTSELVSGLQRLGYLERRADATDKRAKLIFPTARGRHALDDAGDRVAQIEQHWSQILGPERFANTCHALQDLLDTLTRRNDDGA
jgi:DNA-binding MarR family transcriptional regulator